MIKKIITIECKDGFELIGTLYKPTSVIGAIMMAPATGIKRGFYNALASYLAEHGYGVICFDNRGIGESKNGDIKHLNASLIDWGKLDMSAVLDQLQTIFPNQKYHLIGHSAGGQLVGLMENALELTSIFNFACSSGSLRNMNYPFKAQAHFFMNMFIPTSNFLFGKANVQWVGMGEPLPKQVANQWRKWCNGKGYVETDFGKAIKSHYYDDLNIPSMWIHATDDDIANYKNVKDMMRVYSKSKGEIMTLTPNETQIKEIGHMKFFSSKNKILWKHTLDWLKRFD